MNSKTTSKSSLLPTIQSSEMIFANTLLAIPSKTAVSGSMPATSSKIL
jgi:hypothetical protein